MRIHSLTMTGIGPYAGREHIDFDAVGASGRFLLTGPTGSGKTTIIDAIVFALYGDVADSADSSKERIPTPVLHQVRTLTGTMPELLSPAFDDATGAWVRVILQGERPPGALATLKERFPSLLAFQHEVPTRTARERITVTAAADPLRITEDFFDDVCGRAPEPAERGVLRSAYESALAGARSER